MTRARRLLARAIVLAVLLLSLGGSVANADSTHVGCGTQTTALPDDPGYGD